MSLISALLQKDPSLEKKLLQVDSLLLNLPPRVCYTKLSHLLNTFKIATLSVMLLLVYYFQNFSLGAILITSLHGSYGFIWIIKHMAFPDSTFSNKVSLGSLIVCGLVLFFYYGFGFSIICGYGIQDPSPERTLISIFLVCIGSVIMIAADAQKSYTLMLKKGLICTGMFSRTRNPNYLGEMMIYSGFACLTGLWIAWAYLIFVWSLLFAERISMKEASYMKKDGWAEYSKRSGLVLPKLFKNSVIDYSFYVLLVAIGYYFYKNGGIFSLLKK